MKFLIHRGHRSTYLVMQSFMRQAMQYIGMDTTVEPPPAFLATNTATSAGRCCPTLMSRAIFGRIISVCRRVPVRLSRFRMFRNPKVDLKSLPVPALLIAALTISALSVPARLTFLASSLSLLGTMFPGLSRCRVLYCRRCDDRVSRLLRQAKEPVSCRDRENQAAG